MKTLTKILTVVALVVLCVSLFTLTAFAANVQAEYFAEDDPTQVDCDKKLMVHGYMGDDNIVYRSDTTGVAQGAALPDDAVAVGAAADALRLGAQGQKHTWATSAQPYQEANCTTTGNLPYYPCTKCSMVTLDGTTAVPLSAAILQTNDNHDWVPDPSQSKAPTDVSPGWNFYVCSRNPSHTKQETLKALGITAANSDIPIYYVVPINNTWQPGQEGLTFSSSLVLRLNDASGPNANYVGVRLGQSSLYENSWDTFDFWSWDEYVKLGDKQMASLRPGEYKLWIYDKRNPDVFTQSCSFWVLDVPTLEPYSTDKHVVNSSKSLRFITDGEIVPGTIKVGARTLYDANDYFLSNDRKSVTLSPDFLNARQTGTYAISAVTKDGYTIKTNFYILSTAQASSSPRTGDESQIGLWAAFLLLSGAAIVVMVPKLRKHGAK